jgi:hypothetical protein
MAEARKARLGRLRMTTTGSGSSRSSRLRHAGLLSAALLVSCASATPIGVTHVDTQSMYLAITSNVLSADRPSHYSE